jgi:arginine decarboxylase
MSHRVPTHVFAASGIGQSPHKLLCFDSSLRSARINKMNHQVVSSVLPPYCKVVSLQRGLAMIPLGAIIDGAWSRLSTTQNTRVTVACGIAIPRDRSLAGYLTEHDQIGQVEKDARNYAEDMAIFMLAQDFGVKFEIGLTGNARKLQKQKYSHLWRSSCVSASTVNTSPNEEASVFCGYIFCQYKDV